MTTRQLDRSQWQPYFDDINHRLEATQVDLEVSGHDLGVQTEAYDITLIGLSYDPRDDAFSIVTEELEHRVVHPKQISVREDADGLTALEIIDREEHRHVARLRSALRLPSDERPGA